MFAIVSDNRERSDSKENVILNYVVCQELSKFVIDAKKNKSIKFYYQNYKNFLEV